MRPIPISRPSEEPSDSLGFSDSEPEDGDGEERSESPSSTNEESGEEDGEELFDSLEWSDNEPEDSDGEEPISLAEDFSASLPEAEIPVLVPEPTVRQWRDAPRPTTWRSMKSPSKLRLFWVLMATAIAIFQVVRLTLNFLLAGVNGLMARLQGVFNWENAPSYEISGESLGLFGAFLLIFSPFLVGAVLRSYYSLQTLSPYRIGTDYPETAELIRSWRQKHRLLAPKFQLLSTKLPIILTYGSLPFTARVVISSGLLKQLTDAELATLFASQFGQILDGDFLWVSGMTALIQIPYFLYWHISRAGNVAFLSPLQGIIAPIAAFFYGIYRLWHFTLLWLCRQRVYYSDRYGAELTGNPNALCRALLKIANGTSEQVGQLGYTPPILESFGLLLPVDPGQILSLGSLPPRVRYESVLEWDCTNPYRHWLSLPYSHPLLGERLFLLGKCAEFWQVETEIDLPDRRPSLRNKAELWIKLANFQQALPLLPRSFIFAFGLGIILRCAFWLVGIVSEQMEFKPLIWMATAYPLLNAWVGWVIIIFVILLVFLFSKRFPHIFACVVILKTLLDLIGRSSGSALTWLDSRDPFFDAWMFIALSFSMIIWLNGYFPKSKPSNLLENPDLGELLSHPAALPSNGQNVRLRGKLLGREGVANRLAQDLLLQTPTGLIKLKYTAFLGPIGGLVPFFGRPCQYIDREVTVSGWFRRGSAPWIDIETLALDRETVLHGGYQIWFTLLALAAALWGTYQILHV